MSWPSVFLWWWWWLLLAAGAVPECLWGPGEVSLECSIGPESNLTLLQPTNDLRLRCVPALSDFPDQSIRHLKQLRALTVQSCHFRSFPILQGLPELRNFTIKTYEGVEDRELLGDIKVPSDAFAFLHQLEMLDLSHNALRVLPDAVFCPLQSMIFLNLSQNEFTSGFGLQESNHAGGCNLQLENLDLSHNRMRTLHARAFSMLRHLKVLNLKGNALSRAEDDALQGLAKLQLLELSSNEIIALPSRFFQPVSSELTEVFLQNNSLSVLPPGLFSGLSQLLLLDLSQNSITSQWLGPNTFSDLVRLIVLDLSHNHITLLGPSTFRSLYSLQNLQLHHNRIESIADHAFESLYNLNTLVLSHNRLSSIDAYTLSGLSALVTLSIDDNLIREIHPDAFRNITGIMELSAVSNRMMHVPKALGSLQELRTLDLAENNIVDIHNASYLGLFNLYSIRLTDNQIGNLSRGVFHSLPGLRVLILNKNKIQYIEEGTFDEIPELHALQMDSNLLEGINGLFSNLHDLLMLNISANKIHFFDYALIPIGLQWLDVHDNKIESIGNYFALEGVLKLRTLDISYNLITEIQASSLPNGIEIVFLGNNKIKKINPFTFLGKPNLTRVDLTGNNLETLEMNSFRLNEVNLRRPLPEFSISDNPYICDCNMEWLQRLGTLDDSRQYPRMVDVEDIMCQLSFARRRTPMPLMDSPSSQFLCKYKSHCFALCHCCDFDACDCEMVCPDNCTCYYDQSWNTNIVDCNSRGHNAVPKRIPMDVTELYLDGNDIPSLSSHTFIGRKNLRVLYLNVSNVQVIHNRTFNGLKSLQVMHLERNRLKQLHGYEFERLVHLRELYLSHNQISVISNTSFVTLRYLQVLYLDHNNLKEFQVWTFQQFNLQLRSLRISSNPWTCECQFVGNLGTFLEVRGDYVRDLYDLTCVYNSTSSFALVDFNMTTCSNYSSSTLLQTLRSAAGVLPLAGGAALAFCLAVLIIVMCVVIYRKEVGVWLHAKYGLRLIPRSGAFSREEDEKLFDAFVSYSKKDELFVTQIFAPELEGGNHPYRLCLHYRDLHSGGYVMSDALAEAMDSSRRTILVLSENFIKSEWCRYEFKAAHHEALTKDRLIIVTLGRMCARELDPDIRLWLKACTLLRWGEKGFWEKLKYEMPDVCPRERSRTDMVAVHI